MSQEQNWFQKLVAQPEKYPKKQPFISPKQPEKQRCKSKEGRMVKIKASKAETNQI